jgi:hypothetical protein
MKTPAVIRMMIALRFISGAGMFERMIQRYHGE